MEEIDDKQKPTKRSAVTERLRQRNPDMNFDDDEAMFGKIDDDYAEYDRQISDMEAERKNFADIMVKDPRTAQLLVGMRDGKDMITEIFRMYGPDIKEALDDPERLANITAANKEFAEKVAEESKYEETYNANMDQSIDDIDKWQEETGVSDDEINNAIARLMAITKDFVLGKFTPDTIQMLINAANHDSDVATAAHEGEVRGKNAKIEATLKQKRKGDGVSSLSGASKPNKTPKIDGVLGRERHSLWEDEEKRTPGRRMM